jgi:hypothetical protein
MKLEATRAPAEVLVIDRLEKPSEKLIASELVRGFYLPIDVSAQFADALIEVAEAEKLSRQNKDQRSHWTHKRQIGEHMRVHRLLHSKTSHPVIPV